MRKHAANLISLGRLALAPVVFWLILAGYYQLATFIYIVGWVSDAVDGWVARKLGTESSLGEFLDPVCSVPLTYSALFGLVWVGKLHWGFPVAAIAVTGLLSVASLLTCGRTLRRLRLANFVIGGVGVDGGTAVLLVALFVLQALPVLLVSWVIYSLIRFWK